MRTPVHVDLAPDVGSALEGDPDALGFGALNELHWIRSRKQPWSAGWKTIAFGIVFGFVQRVVVVHRRSPRLERNPRFRRSSSALTAACGSSAFTAANLSACCRRRLPNSQHRHCE